jgi:hypothetical protein
MSNTNVSGGWQGLFVDVIFVFQFACSIKRTEEPLPNGVTGLFTPDYIVKKCIKVNHRVFSLHQKLGRYKIGSPRTFIGILL